MKRQQKCYITLAAALLLQTILPNASFAQTDDMANMPDMANQASVQTTKTIKVGISDFAFSPATITIHSGDTITWTNNDSAVHNAASTASAPTAFQTKDLNQGETDSVTFTKPGTYAYICSYHPGMKGKVIVNPIKK